MDHDRFRDYAYRDGGVAVIFLGKGSWDICVYLYLAWAVFGSFSLGWEEFRARPLPHGRQAVYN
jgi:hypothetical protein